MVYRPVFSDFVELCKPRVVALMVLTAFVAMLLAVPDGAVPWWVVSFACVGIAGAAGAGGAINHLIDRRIDAMMARTERRPLPTGRIQLRHAIILASGLSLTSLLIMVFLVNVTAAVLSVLTLVGYAGVYTLLLKRATPQNIVIGGLAGAMPPLLGWSSITGQIDGAALLLVLIIFTWTPPHFWALAIYRHKEYERANVPMLPVTHGLHFTKLNILLYSLLLVAVTALAFVVDVFGLIYCAGMVVLNIWFMVLVLRLYRSSDHLDALRVFRFSITYLGLLFVLMLVDHYCPLLI